MTDKEQKSLEEWMLERGFTQRSLAREAGVSHSIINLIIDGTRVNVRSDTRGKIARTLGVEIRQITEFDRMIRDQLGKGLPVNTISGTGSYATGVGMALPSPAL